MLTQQNTTNVMRFSSVPDYRFLSNQLAFEAGFGRGQTTEFLSTVPRGHHLLYSFGRRFLSVDAHADERRVLHFKVVTTFRGSFYHLFPYYGKIATVCSFLVTA